MFNIWSNDKKVIFRINTIQEYLTCHILQEETLFKFLPVIDDRLFGKYEKVWTHIRKSWNKYEPDLVELAHNSWIKDPGEIIVIWMREYGWNPRRYLEELIKTTHFLDYWNYKIESYKELISILEKIAEIDSWLQWTQYSSMTIAWNIMDSIHSWKYLERTKVWINEIDNLLWGWIPKWSVTTIGAYSNTGKSKYAYNLSANFLKQWKKVLFFNLEVPKETAYQNILASYSWEHIDTAVRNNWKDYVWEYLDKYIDLPIMSVDDKWDWESIEAMINVHRPDVAFIDFVQNVETTGENIYEKTSSLAKKIQRLAIERDMIIISISQLSNEWARWYSPGSVIPMKWGGELVASSDICLMLQNDTTNKWIINLTIAKNKFGRKDETFGLSVDYKNNIFKLIDANVPKVIYK